MILDLLLIAVGWVLVTTAATSHLRHFRNTKFGPFAPHEQRITAPGWNWRVSTLFMAGVIVAVWGGADAQRHYIGYWAQVRVFVPMMVAVARVTVVHNRRVKPDAAK